MLAEEYIRSTVRSILMEEANKDDVVDAIKKKYEVDITYDDGANGPRRIQPCAYGRTSKGNLVLRAYQPEGSSLSSSHGWKYFLLDRIQDWSPRKDEHFSEPPEFRADGPYNPNGDKSMSEVYLIADFGNSNGGDLETGETENEPNVQQQQSMNIPVSKSGSNISGVKTDNDSVNPYYASAREMSSSNNFGSDNATETVGPVKKNDTETSDNTSVNSVNDGDYNNAEQNSPIYKTNTEKEPEENYIDAMEFVDDKEKE